MLVITGPSRLQRLYWPLGERSKKSAGVSPDLVQLPLKFQTAGVLHEGKSFISNPKDKGWEFRTPEQFAAEQAVIKALKKKPEQVKRTPRRKSRT